MRGPSATGFASKAAEGVGLAGAGAEAGERDALDAAFGEADLGGAGAQGGKADGQRAVAVKGAQGAEAVADAGDEHFKLRALGEMLAVLESVGVRKRTRRRWTSAPGGARSSATGSR